MSDQTDTPHAEERKLVELLDDMPIAMMTTVDARGDLRALPMARQEVEPTADLWFITARDTQHVDDIRARPQVGLTFSARDSWVSLRGRAEVVDDETKLRELWNTFAEAWLPGGPEDPNAVLIHVTVDHGEYWDSPGGKVASLISFAKAKLTGDTYDADTGKVDL
ncbi:pyridoxamine 5'-phosphate oxidase family protein [Nocardioides sp. NPDC092400]|uniref:pyridoxamine 5'-phosphate oxidase family protein n=1 Tax=Nocardioides sp. NPDC092400 TaxID=3155196 RepID=UPI003438AF23